MLIKLERVSQAFAEDLSDNSDNSGVGLVIHKAYSTMAPNLDTPYFLKTDRIDVVMTPDLGQGCMTKFSSTLEGALGD